MPPITPKQLAAARSLLGWSRERLGALSGTSAHQIMYYERWAHVISSDPRLAGEHPLCALRTALEAAGVEFVGRKGVRLRHDVPTLAGMPHVDRSVRLAAFHKDLRKWHLEMARKHGRYGE